MSTVPPGRRTTRSEQETRKVARELVDDLSVGTTLLLSGDLGAGKTAFVKGLAEGLGLEANEITSPTFALVHEYLGGRVPLVHVDLYRLEEANLDELGVDVDVLSRSITAIEWPERLAHPVPGARRIQIVDGGGSRRTIEIG